MNDLVFNPEQAKTARLPQKPWKVMVVDDEPEIHTVTQFALQEFRFDDRPLQLLRADSGDECLRLMEQHPDTAVLLLDVVMETRNAGLEVVGYIRKVLANSQVRIIIRTGQPGDFPEHELITAYDINDYREKTELTIQKLRTSLTAALRAWRDLEKIRNSESLLRSISRSSTALISTSQPTDLTSLFLDSFEALLRGTASAHPHSQPDLVLLEVDRDGGQNILGARGSWASLGPIEAASLLRSIGRRETFDPDHCYWILDSRVSRRLHLAARWTPDLQDYERDLLLLFLEKAGAIFETAELVQNLETRSQELARSLTEKDLLIKEIHHRVKNNLQIISSLLSLEDTALSQAGQTLFADTAHRITSMAMVHERLFQSRDLTRIDLAAYTSELVQDLGYRFHLHDRLTLGLPDTPVMAAIDYAVPFGLLANEILTLSARHAQSTASQVQFTLGLSADTLEITLTLHQGQLPPPGPLIDLLVGQLKGSHACQNGSNSCYVHLPLPAGTS